MNKLRNLSLIIILPSILLGAFAILQGSLFFNEYHQQQHKLYGQAKQDIKALAGQLQTSLSNSLMRLDKAQAQDIVSTAALNENVQSVVVVDKNHQIILSNNFREKYMFSRLLLERYEGDLLTRVINENEIVIKYFIESKQLVVYAPLQMISKGNSLNRRFNGVIFIRYSLTSAYNQLAHTAQTTFIKYSIVFLLIISFYIYCLNRLVIIPLKRLTYSTAITDLTNEHQIEQTGFGEIAFLQGTFAKLISEMSYKFNQLAAREQRWLYAINGARDGIWDWDIKNGQVYYSNRWKEMLGYNATQIKNDIFEWESRIHPDDVFNVFEDLSAHFNGRNSFFENTHRIKCYNGEYRWVLSRGQAVCWDTKGEPLRITGTHTDVSLYKEILEKIKYQEQFNEVTELPNRLQLTAYLTNENLRLQSNGLYGALILMNCNQDKTINSLEDLEAGEQLLYWIARRLEKNKTEFGFVAYLQGFEFVVILSDLHSNLEQATDLAINFTKRLDAALKQPFKLGDQEYLLHCAYGVTLYPKQDIQVKDLLKQASTAIKIDQANHHGNISLFTNLIQEKINRTQELQSQIRKGLENDEFSLCFQPRVDAQGKLVGAEALSRWFRDQTEWVEPADFIPVAEDSGLIIPLGDWVIIKAFTELKSWIERGLPECFKTLSINVSPKQLLQQNFNSVVEKYLLETGIDANLIEIEITETVLASHTELIINKLNDLRKLGLRFSIDDFGTGYSSFSYLSILPVSALKIDQSFIANILQQENQQVIVSAIINMGKSLKLEVVAEGVETQEQLDFLIEKGCTQFQGYFVGTPSTSKDFQTILVNAKSKFKRLEN